MSDRKKISLETLSSIEKMSINKFLKEAYNLFLLAKSEEPFYVWLDLLTEGIHEAYQNTQRKAK